MRSEDMRALMCSILAVSMGGVACELSRRSSATGGGATSEPHFDSARLGDGRSERAGAGSGPAEDCVGVSEPPMVRGVIGHDDVVKLCENRAAMVILAQPAHAVPGVKLPTLGERNRLPRGPGPHAWAGPWVDAPSFALCSGVLIAENIVMTNKHCSCLFDSFGDIRVRSMTYEKEWREVEAIKRASNGLRDVAYLRLSRGFDGARVVEPVQGDVDVGTDAYLIGSPLGIPDVVSKGEVAGYQSDGRERGHSAYVAYGSSGGGMFRSSDGAFLGLQTEGTRTCPTLIPGTMSIGFPSECNGKRSYVTLAGDVEDAMDVSGWEKVAEIEKNMFCKGNYPEEKIRKKRNKKSIPDDVWDCS